jgi:hypothetical protein
MKTPAPKFRQPISKAEKERIRHEIDRRVRKRHGLKDRANLGRKARFA